MSTHTITFELAKIPSNAKLREIAKQSARNLISLFADHESEIQEAITESEEAKTTFNHSIVLDLGKHKQTDKLGFSIKRGDEITMSIPDPDQGDLFDDLNPRDLRSATKKPSVVVEAEILGLPAPIEVLPAPDTGSMTADEQEAFELGKSRFQPGFFWQDACTYGDSQNHLWPAFEKGWKAALRQWRIEKSASELLACQADPHELDVWESNCDDGEFPEILRLAIDTERGGKARKRTLQRLEAALAKACPPTCLEEREGLTDSDSDDTAAEEE